MKTQLERLKKVEVDLETTKRNEDTLNYQKKELEMVISKLQNSLEAESTKNVVLEITLQERENTIRTIQSKLEQLVKVEE